jgi:hypothetical protein
MEQISTSNQLISFIYRETSFLDRLLLEDELSEDVSLQIQLQELREGYQRMPKVTFNPKATTLQSILKYSRKQEMGVY